MSDRRYRRRYWVQLWRHYVLSPWRRDGRVVADSVTVAAEVSGRIVEIRVRENEYVRKGDILFTVDPASYKAAVDNAKANVASTLATMEMRESNAARGHKLTRLSISAQEQEDLDLAAKTAEANYQQAQAVCENAEINFDRTVVHAPVNGYVIAKDTQKNQQELTQPFLLAHCLILFFNLFAGV